MYDYQNNLKKLRKERGLTQLDLAILLDTTIQQYSRYELKQRELPLHHAIKLSYFYNISMDEMFKKLYNYE